MVVHDCSGWTVVGYASVHPRVPPVSGNACLGLLWFCFGLNDFFAVLRPSHDYSRKKGTFHVLSPCYVRFSHQFSISATTITFNLPQSEGVQIIGLKRTKLDD